MRNQSSCSLEMSSVLGSVEDTQVYLGLNAVQSIQNSLQLRVGSTDLQETSTG